MKGTGRPAAYLDFLREFRQEYDALDRRCDGLRAGEKGTGAFTALGGSVFRAGT